MKTARFAELVKRAGRPETHLLWSAPKQDRALQRALKENRVLMVHQENVGAKKDYGMVGFREDPRAQILIFPKSVRAFEGRRVVGINYDLLAGAEELVSASAARKVEGKGRVKVKRKGKVGSGAPVEARKSETSAGEGKARVAEAREEEGKIVAFETGVAKARKERPQAKKRSKKAGTKAEKVVGPKGSAKGAKAKKETGEVKRTSGVVLDPRVKRVVEQAMKDLDAGRAVAAYKRLEMLVEKRAER